MYALPKFYKAKQVYPNQEVEDIKKTTYEEVEKVLTASSLEKGKRIGITAGSRGISNIKDILKYMVEKLKIEGYLPFLFSAKGSHGGGKAVGQMELLRSLGITEDYIGAEIICSPEVVHLGETIEFLPGLPIYTAKEAVEADGILVVNRIKPHTNFSGEFESGIMKMLSVGMGRAKGASMVHKLGTENLLSAIKAIGKGVLDRLPVLGAIAIVENAYERTSIIEGIPVDSIMKREPILLSKAKSMMPSLPCKELDLLVVQQIGKNFSGTGMDTNIIGRIRINGVPEPDDFNINYIGALTLSEESHGNATGVGLADFTTKRLVEQIDFQKTYKNVLTSGNVTRVAIPLTTDNDYELLNTVIQALKPDDVLSLKIFIIKNTLHINEFWFSEGLLTEMKVCNHVDIVSNITELKFDENHHLILDE